MEGGRTLTHTNIHTIHCWQERAKIAKVYGAYFRWLHFIPAMYMPWDRYYYSLSFRLNNQHNFYHSALALVLNSISSKFHSFNSKMIDNVLQIMDAMLNWIYFFSSFSFYLLVLFPKTHTHTQISFVFRLPFSHSLYN